MEENTTSRKSVGTPADGVSGKDAGDFNVSSDLGGGANANCGFCHRGWLMQNSSDADFNKGKTNFKIGSGAFFGRRKFLQFLAYLSALPLFWRTAEALDIKGVTYVSVPQLAKMLGMRWKTIVPKKRQNIYGTYSQLSFDVNQRDMVLNGNRIWLGFPVALAGETLYVAMPDYYKTILPILYPSRSGKAPWLYSVVIDAGHGGKDNGAQNRRIGLVEKYVTFDMARRVGDLLKAKGITVFYTRTKDKFVELEDRSKYANAKKASMFLSIHFNAAGPSAAGVETFSLTPSGQPSTSSAGASIADKRVYRGNAFDPWNTLLAYYVQTQMKQKTGAQDRGIKRARFVVLKNIAMPAILVEGGFVSNPYEGKNIMSAKYRQKLAEGIVAGIMKYSGTLSRLRKK